MNSPLSNVEQVSNQTKGDLFFIENSARKPVSLQRGLVYSLDISRSFFIIKSQ
jgi:hypothetical protein